MPIPSRKLRYSVLTELINCEFQFDAFGIIDYLFLSFQIPKFDIDERWSLMLCRVLMNNIHIPIEREKKTFT